MDPVEEIRRAQESTLVDERGREVTLELAPPLTTAEIEQLATETGAPLPRQLRAVLEHTSRIEGSPLDAIDFTGRTMDFEDRDLFPAGLPIAHDGSGNFWVLDLSPQETESGVVFFASHDPPVLVYQSEDLGRFLHEIFRMLEPPHSSDVDEVREHGVFSVWRENVGALTHSEAMAGDEPLRAFAGELDDRYLFVDLRSPEVGAGLSWGRYGPRTDVRRDGYERLFAYAPPEKKAGLLSRLFTR